MRSLFGKLVIGLINPDLIISLVKLILGVLEQAIKSTSTDWDDKNILPIVEKLKKALGV
jgi:hypothetical protein